MFRLAARASAPPSQVLLFRVILGLLPVCMLVVAGCGEPGAPQPPSLNLPVPVQNLSAMRRGNAVTLAWSTTDRTTDHTPVQGLVRLRICRIEGTGPCELVSEQPQKLGHPSSYTDLLPTDVLQGQPQLLTYYVELFNHAKKSAGRSNPAFSASGPSLPELSDLSATVRSEGVELRWRPVEWRIPPQGERFVQITRRDQTPAPPRSSVTAGKPLLAPVSNPLSETLEVKVPPSAGTTGPGRAIDPTAAFGQTYQYRAVRVERQTLEGHAIEVYGRSSATLDVTPRDTFPPAVPQQLAAVADPVARAIDLSWSADSDSDLAGYFVYRRLANGSDALRRISGRDPLPAPAYHDADVRPDLAYAYSVSAVDTSGNESTHSAEVVETLPAQP